MEHCKLQIGCLLIILYILFVYVRDRRRFRQVYRPSVFDALLGLSILELLLDGATAYTVNHLDTVDPTLNRVLHLFFLLSLDCFIFCIFLYMVSITTGLPRRKPQRALQCTPFLVNALLLVVNIPSLTYYQGDVSNYSMGVSAYTCFIMAGIYILLSMFLYVRRWRQIETHKRVSILTYLLVLACITVYQMFHPQALLTGIGVTVIVLGVYLNQENPAVTELEHYHREMIMGFATLVENKDGSTGGHIRRTTLYVKLLAEELRRRGFYQDVLTRDYIKNLCLAAPMHDIGKISVPDVILQKPGKLTQEEFECIKAHAANGGRIIQETFGHIGSEAYAQMAYEVARCHHEKWNGKGYPDGLRQEEIPLCARIMAIADVFDAVSEKRCYRDALPLEECFQIIQEGSGRDFDPLLTEVFLSLRDQVAQAHRSAAPSGFPTRESAF